MSTILIVDDRPSNRRYLSALLGHTGHRLLEAYDGAHALAQVRAERPDLIITDILMPAMDGYEFVQQLRADPELAATRVIFYSAIYAVSETMALARSCGVSRVLAKPADPEDILAAVHGELGLAHQAGERAGTIGAAAMTAAAAVGTNLGSSIDDALVSARHALGALLDRHAVANPALGSELASLLGERMSGLRSVAARLAALEEMSLRLTGERNADAMLGVFLQAASAILDADCVAVCLLDSGEQRVRHLGTLGVGRELLMAAALDPQRLPGALLEQPLALRVQGQAALPAGHPAADGFLGLAIRDRNQLYGWMYCTRGAGAQPFSHEDERIGVTLGAQLAVAYENLCLYEVVQRHAAQLQLEAAARQQADRALRESEQRLRLSARILESTQESIMMTDAHADIIAVNPAFEHITGYSEADVLGRNPRLLRSGRHDTAFYRAIWVSLTSTGQWRGEIWNRRKNGQVYPERISINAVRGAGGEIDAYVSVSSDISALKAAHHQVDFLSNHDPLTLLPNRSVLTERMQQAIASARHGDRQIALLLFNIDRLQRINDSLGHEAGDALLREVARRAGLLAGPADSLAHLGSDEFVLLLTECLDSDAIIVAVRRLIDEIAQPFHADGHELIVTTSVGISIYPRDGANPSELLKAADVALSHMKDAGRNGFRFFKGEMNAHALRWMALETHLRRAIERNELSLHYQPQVSLGDGRICSMEALLRWSSPELGQVGPGDFIALAEDTGLILPIGNWVIRQACMQNKAWQDAGLAPLRVAVNVSAHQFTAGTVPAVVREALRESGLAPQYLEIELTESVMMRDSEAAEVQLAELTGMGVSISLDDFGTGYSSLGYLSRFMLDKLKIDQSFVRNIITDPRSAAIAQATIALAHGLSLSVVAEGVETQEQLAFLQRIGCDEVQGYLFSRPLAADAMAALIASAARLALPVPQPLPVGDRAKE
ncbi:EAL domain-containing protein [Massilia sp. CCM 8734]|uniref:two-component system response regulator n=1 Tax=Massilia sp. CCM 8734 TaxID=2609283 RepID=UPI001E613B69|nr:EAL domain-containing protein [Massilia sp. CCM 8734]